MSGVGMGLGIVVWRRNYKPSALKVAEADLALRMRNQLALQLLDRADEHVVDDEPVLVSSGASLGKRAAGQGLPEPGWMIVSTTRLLFATISDKSVTELLLTAPKVTHVEDGWVTLAWRENGRTSRAVTFGFGPKSTLISELLTRLPGEKVFTGAGAATPGRATLKDRAAARIGRKPTDR